MQPLKALISLSVLLLIFGVFVPVTSAQDEDEPLLCSYFTVDEDEIPLGTFSFIDCAFAMFYQMLEDGLAEAYGYWDIYLVYVNDFGEVYYAEDAEEPEWFFWSELDFEDSEPIPDDFSDVLTFEDTMELATFDINYFWEQIFAEAEIEYTPPNSLFFGTESVSSLCGDMSASRGPFYCGGEDDTMYFPVAFMMDQFSRIGDFAPVLVMAHEWGHAIQMRLDLMVTQMSIDMELQADCLAGGYASYAATQSEFARLSADDIDEGLQSLFEVGDSEETPWFDPQAHGTSEERQQAFLYGYENGVYLCFE